MARALRHRDRAGRGGGRAPTTASRPATSTTPSPTPTSARGPREVAGELWNATGFRGAELTYAELLAAPRPARRGARVLHDPQGGTAHEADGIACWPPTSCPRAASRRSRPATRASRSSTTTGSSPRSTTAARTRAARSARARSRTACCAARGTASTTARSTARSPGFDDEATTYPLEIRDGEVFVGVEEEPHVATVTDLMAETMVNWGVEHVFGMVGHSNLGLADALRRQEEAGQAHLHRHPPRGRRRVRRLRLRQAHRPPGGVPDDRRPRRHEPAHRAVGREGRPRAGARAHRPGQHAGARPGRVPGGRPVRRVRLGRRVEPAGAARLQPGRADEPRVQERAAAARRRAPDLPRRGADAARRPTGAEAGGPDGRVTPLDDLAARGVARGRAAAARAARSGR